MNILQKVRKAIRMPRNKNIVTVLQESEVYIREQPRKVILTMHVFDDYGFVCSGKHTKEQVGEILNNILNQSNGNEGA